MHPFFIRVAEYQKEVTRLSNSKSDVDRAKAVDMTVNMPPELTAEAERLHDDAAAAGTLRHRPSIQVYGADGYPPGSVIPEVVYIRHRTCFFKFHKTVKQLEEEKAAGSFEAARKLISLDLEVEKWRFGKIDLNKVRYKTSVDHFGLVSLGLDLGILSLTANELADCFDALCPCGKVHDPESLFKLRQRINKTFPPH
jgi:hypothetical protein